MRAMVERFVLLPLLLVALLWIGLQIRPAFAEDTDGCDMAVSIAAYAAAMADEGIKQEAALSVIARAIVFSDEGQAWKMVQGIVHHAYDKERRPLPEYTGLVEFACKRGQLKQFILPEA